MSIAETLWVGTRIAFACTRRRAPGQAFDAARQAGRHRMIDCIAERVRRRSAWVAVDQRLVVHCRMQCGEQGLLDADLAVQAVEHRNHGVGGA